jgi:hypothetical protein
VNQQKIIAKTAICFSKGLAYNLKGQWDDVHKAQNLGYTVHPGFLKALRQASGRQK